MARVKSVPKRVLPASPPFRVRSNAWRFRFDLRVWTPYTRAMNKRVYKTASRVELAKQLNAYEVDLLKCKLCFDRC